MKMVGGSSRWAKFTYGELVIRDLPSGQGFWVGRVIGCGVTLDGCPCYMVQDPDTKTMFVSTEMELRPVPIEDNKEILQ